jgi:hypothetical protein
MAVPQYVVVNTTRARRAEQNRQTVLHDGYDKVCAGFSVSWTVVRLAVMHSNEVGGLTRVWKW